MAVLIDHYDAASGLPQPKRTAIATPAAEAFPYMVTLYNRDSERGYSTKRLLSAYCSSEIEAYAAVRVYGQHLDATLPEHDDRVFFVVNRREAFTMARFTLRARTVADITYLSIGAAE